MRFWEKPAPAAPATCGVARIAVEGGSRGDLVAEALRKLARGGDVTRAGVWLESEPSAAARGPLRFHGALWDIEGQTPSGEWSQLSPEAPLPPELIAGLQSVEQDLDHSHESMLIGALVELRRALWVPIEAKGRLLGVLLAGTRRKPAVLPRELAENLAAELALAVELLDQQRAMSARQTDTALARRILTALGNSSVPDDLLFELAQSCTISEDRHSGPGAAFALIGSLAQPGPGPGESANLDFHWQSGGSAWKCAAENEPLAAVWRKALAARRVVGSEPDVSWSHGEVARIVAIPIGSRGRLLGALVAGLSPGSASLAALDRLELRAALAGLALDRRVQDREELRRAAWQKALLESNEEPAIFLDASGRVAAMSRGARDLLGESVKEFSGLLENENSRPDFAELFRAADREHIENWARRRAAARSAGRTSVESLPEGELRNGERVRVRRVVSADEDFTAVILDVPQRQRAGDAAGRVEAELQSVIEWLEEGVILFDARENVRAVNSRFEQIAGLAPEESGKYKTLEAWIERMELQVAEPAGFSERWRELARGIEGGVREELHLARPIPRILERASRVVLDAAGKRLGRLEIYRDLTAQRVFQSKLLQTEKLATLGQMVTGVAHELSNPLTSILGYSQRLLLRQDSTGKFSEAQQIYQEAERASGILRQLLFSARESPPERRPVALNHIVQRTMDLQRFGMTAERVRVELDLDPLIPYVLGDSGQLQQVLMNLVGNARQALEQHGQGGTILLRTKRIAERRVLLEVSDDGPGIPQAIQARIFDPFFTTKPAGVGTGLGLAIVLNIVREHGGRVHLSSPPSGGATFSIELPGLAPALYKKEENPVFKQPPRASAIPAERPEERLLERPGERPQERPAAQGSSSGPLLNRSSLLSSGRVLVVEDEPTVARLIADVLEDEGLHVEVLLDGREALERAAREPFDLVICDMKMPGIDGQHFYKSLVRSGNPLRERFLFVTGDVIAPHTHEFLEQNHLPHVAKPFRMEELTEKVWRVLGSKSHSQGSPAIARGNVAGNG
jgi:signal transduction histidine kinase